MRYKTSWSNSKFMWWCRWPACTKRLQRWAVERVQQSGCGILTRAQSTIRSGGVRGNRAHSHVNNYRRVSNYKAPLQPADTYSSHVRAARDSFLRALDGPRFAADAAASLYELRAKFFLLYGSQLTEHHAPWNINDHIKRILKCKLFSSSLRERVSEVKKYRYLNRYEIYFEFPHFIPLKYVVSITI